MKKLGIYTCRNSEFVMRGAVPADRLTLQPNDGEQTISQLSFISFSIFALSFFPLDGYQTAAKSMPELASRESIIDV